MSAGGARLRPAAFGAPVAALSLAAFLLVAERSTARGAGVTPRPAQCSTGADPIACGSTGDYCLLATGVCEGVGRCEPRPLVCPRIFQPVCGCDDETYASSCEAAARGVNLRDENACGQGSTPTPTPAPTRRSTPTAGLAPCAGDCDGDGLVTMDELVTAVGLALVRGAGDCCAADRDRNDSVSVDELVGAVGVALNGCRVPALPLAAYFWPDRAFGLTGSALADLAEFGLHTVVAYYEYVKPDVPPFGGQPDCAGLVREAEAFSVGFFIGAPDGNRIRALDDDQLTTRLRATVDCVGSSAHYRGWMIDEPELTGYDRELVGRVAAILRRIDPSRRLWVNFSPHAADRQVMDLSADADVIGYDVYPVREGDGSPFPNQPLDVVGDLTARANALAPPGADVWMVLQAFGYSDLPNEGGRGRRPTPTELRFMVYDALVHGARGIAFFGSHQLRDRIPLDEPVWDVGVRGIARELEAIGPALRFGAVVSGIAAEPAELAWRGVRWAGEEFLLVVNESGAATGGSISLVGDLTGARELFENRAIAIEQSRMTDSFPPWGVHVYRLSR